MGNLIKMRNLINSTREFNFWSNKLKSFLFDLMILANLIKNSIHGLNLLNFSFKLNIPSIFKILRI